MTEHLTAAIYPEPRYLSSVARHLLKLAERAQDVEYVSWPQAGFRVTEEVLLLWESELATDDKGEPSLELTYPAGSKAVLTHTNPVTKADVEVAAVREAAEEPKELAKAKKKPGPKPKTTLIEEGE